VLELPFQESHQLKTSGTAVHFSTLHSRSMACRTNLDWRI